MLWLPPSRKRSRCLPTSRAEVGALAKAEGKKLSAVVQDALGRARIERRPQELQGVQGYWSRKARDQGILTEKGLERYAHDRRSFSTPTFLSRRWSFPADLAT